MMKITDKIVNIIPKREFNGERSEKIIKWFGEHVSTPEARIIIGVTALATQPWIDLNNKNTDEKTRKISACRTVGKIIAGTITGYSIRAGFIKFVKNYSELGAPAKKIKKLFTPTNAKADMPYAYKQYQNAMGMLFAIVGLTISGFLIDAPLTNFLTNTMTKTMEGKHEKR